MNWQELNVIKILPFSPVLFKIVVNEETFYTTGHTDCYGDLHLDVLQNLADHVTHYVEIY